VLVPGQVCPISHFWCKIAYAHSLFWFLYNTSLNFTSCSLNQKRKEKEKKRKKEKKKKTLIRNSGEQMLDTVVLQMLSPQSSYLRSGHF